MTPSEGIRCYGKELTLPKCSLEFSLGSWSVSSEPWNVMPDRGVCCMGALAHTQRDLGWWLCITLCQLNLQRVCRARSAMWQPTRFPWLGPINTLDLKAWVIFPGCPHRAYYDTLLSTTPPGGIIGSSMMEPSWTLPCPLLPLADVNLYPLTVLNCNHEYNNHFR